MNYNSTPSQPNTTTTVTAPKSGPDQATIVGTPNNTSLLPRDQEFLYITAVTKGTTLSIKDVAGATVNLGAIPTCMGLSSPIICLSFSATSAGDVLYYVQ